jgi:hypothetical protein
MNQLLIWMLDGNQSWTFGCLAPDAPDSGFTQPEATALKSKSFAGGARNA